MNRIFETVRRYRQLISYLFFGVCTTILNTLCYYLCYNILHRSNVFSTVVAWVAAVIAAYLTNKFWVFESRDTRPGEIMRELLSFFSVRIGTGVLDVGIMFVAVDLCQGNSVLWKLISNFLVVVINYIASKLVIFKQKSDIQ